MRELTLRARVPLEETVRLGRTHSGPVERCPPVVMSLSQLMMLLALAAAQRVKLDVGAHGG